MAVVAALNNRDDTLECLDSLFRSEYDALRVVLVDNGSTDGTAAAVRLGCPTAHVIETDRNLGFSGGYNVGIRWALAHGADYVLMLNNDTIVAPDMVRELVADAETHPALGISMPKILYHGAPDLVWSAGARYRTLPPAVVMIGLGDHDGPEFGVPRRLDYAPGCGLLIHRRTFERAGLWDEGFFFFFEDCEFCDRVRQHGLEIRYVPRARMWHKVSRTTRREPETYWRVWGASCARYYGRYGTTSVVLHCGYLALRELIQGHGSGLPFFAAGALSELRRAG